jgi:hypothetical protein
MSERIKKLMAVHETTMFAHGVFLWGLAALVAAVGAAGYADLYTSIVLDWVLIGSWFPFTVFVWWFGVQAWAIWWAR